MKKHNTNPFFQPKGYLSKNEVAKIFGVPQYRVTYWESKGKLHGKKFDLAGNKTYFHEEEVARLKTEFEATFEGQQ